MCGMSFRIIYLVHGSFTRKLTFASQRLQLMVRGALGSGLAIFTKFPIVSAEAHPYSLSGCPHHPTEGDFFVNKAAGCIVLLHPYLGEVEVWSTHVSLCIKSRLIYADSQMHASGEHPPDTRQAHRIAQSWQLANLIRSGAAKGRYIIAVGPAKLVPERELTDRRATLTLNPTQSLSRSCAPTQESPIHSSIPTLTQIQQQQTIQKTPSNRLE